MEDFSQETAFPTLQIATQLKDFASPDYTAASSFSCSRWAYCEPEHRQSFRTSRANEQNKEEKNSLTKTMGRKSENA